MNATMEQAYQQTNQVPFVFNGANIIIWGLLISILLLAILSHGNIRKILYASGAVLFVFFGLFCIQEYNFNQKAHTFKFQMAYYESLYKVTKKLSTAQKQHYNLAVVKKRIDYRLNKSQMQRLNADLKVQQKIADEAFIDWNNLDNVKSAVQSNPFNDNASYLSVPTELNHTYPIYWNVQDMNLIAIFLPRQYLYQDGLRHDIDNLKTFKYQHYNDYHLQQQLIKEYEH